MIPGCTKACSRTRHEVCTRNTKLRKERSFEPAQEFVILNSALKVIFCWKSPPCYSSFSCEQRVGVHYLTTKSQRKHIQSDPKFRLETMAFLMKSITALFLAAALLVVATEGFASPSTGNRAQTQLFAEEKGGFFGAVSNFFEELDAFVDDATARRLGNGAAYYGKRKSSFYGKEDSMKKPDKNVMDSSEDYMVQSGGNYKWIQDENGQMRPVSRMKNKNLEKPLAFWGRQDNKEEE